MRVHDFLIKELGRAVPHGIYDLAANAGWASVGIDYDTAEFAVQTIRTWWRNVAPKRYANARHLTITADDGAATARACDLLSERNRHATEGHRGVPSPLPVYAN